MTLAVTSIPLTLPGDYNGDGIVDAADYTVWRDTLDSTTNLAADGDGNGIVDQNDYDVWQTNFGNQAGPGGGPSGSSTASVPEPPSLLLLLMAASGSLLSLKR